MSHYRGLKQDFIQRFVSDAHHSLRAGDARRSEHQLDNADLLRSSQTIIFSAEQAAIFAEISSTYTDTIDYRLPFNLVFLQFDAPVTIYVQDKGNMSLLAMFLIQFRDVTESDEFLNMAHAWFVDKETTSERMLSFRWEGDDLPFIKDQLTEGVLTVRSLAIACIGYINCENIYLHQEGVEPEAVNRKRARQGKKLLEPYYLCRIRGVEYDENGEPTGEGTHHGVRYDVRGHFRKLATGKTTWVRPHQRGLQHELYVPKTYVVEKETSS